MHTNKQHHKTVVQWTPPLRNTILSHTSQSKARIYFVPKSEQHLHNLLSEFATNDISAKSKQRTVYYYKNFEANNSVYMLMAITSAGTVSPLLKQCYKHEPASISHALYSTEAEKNIDKINNQLCILHKNETVTWESMCKSQLLETHQIRKRRLHKSDTLSISIQSVQRLFTEPATIVGSITWKSSISDFEHELLALHLDKHINPAVPLYEISVCSKLLNEPMIQDCYTLWFNYDVLESEQDKVERIKEEESKGIYRIPYNYDYKNMSTETLLKIVKVYPKKPKRHYVP